MSLDTIRGYVHSLLEDQALPQASVSSQLLPGLGSSRCPDAVAAERAGLPSRPLTWEGGREGDWEREEEARLAVPSLVPVGPQILACRPVSSQG